MLPLNKRSRAWVKNLPIIVNDLNNSVSRLIGMRNMCLQNRPSPRNGPMGYDKIRLTHNDSVRYLLDAGELEVAQLMQLVSANLPYQRIADTKKSTSFVLAAKY